MKNTSFSEKQKALAERLKQEPARVPVQKVVPLTDSAPALSAEKRESKKEVSTQISAWIPNELLVQVREKAFREHKKLTTVLEELLQEYVRR